MIEQYLEVFKQYLALLLLLSPVIRQIAEILFETWKGFGVGDLFFTANETPTDRENKALLGVYAKKVVVFFIGVIVVAYSDIQFPLLELPMWLSYAVGAAALMFGAEFWHGVIKGLEKVGKYFSEINKMKRPKMKRPL